jgi:hypothetical protein
MSFAVVPCRCQMCDGRFFRPRWMVPTTTAEPKDEKANAAQG